MGQNLFRYIFWIGYLVVLATAFISITGDLTKISFGPESFHIRLDHLLHFAVYSLICMYYLFGIRKGITLFEKNSLSKFILLILLLATVTEVVQLWVPERAFNPMDWVANVTGMAVGLVVILVAGKR